jgi:NADH:ubiquinone oxidoreductase subunit 4 (subunit M)
VHDVSSFEWVAWTPILALIVFLGVWPHAIFHMTDQPVACKTVREYSQPIKGDCAKAVIDTTNVAAPAGG